MMYFYQPKITQGINTLAGDEMLHCAKVLRKKVGDQIGILDGHGGFYITEIKAIKPKELVFEILESEQLTQKRFHHHIAISPTKNTDRIEWFVEKACELGVDEISFVFTTNSERKQIKTDRLIKKAISALKQSKSGFITRINEATKFDNFLKQHKDSSNRKYLAHVSEGLPYFAETLIPETNILTLIGPEGDFTAEEVRKSLSFRYEHISLGQNVLRTETAGIVACQFVNMANQF